MPSNPIKTGDRPTPVYLIAVNSPNGWVVTKGRYATRKDARDWESFVRGAWCCRTRVVTFAQARALLAPPDGGRDAQ